jgi:hypothetical protein
METRQPHSTITTGVRHPIVEAFVTEGNETAMIGNPYRECENNRHTKKDATAAPRDPNALQVEALRIAVGRDFLDRDPGGCLYGLAPSIPKRKVTKNFFGPRMAVNPARAGGRQTAVLCVICSNRE